MEGAGDKPVKTRGLSIPQPESALSRAWKSSEPGVMMPFNGTISAMRLMSSSGNFLLEKSAQERTDPRSPIPGSRPGGLRKEDDEPLGGFGER